MQRENDIEEIPNQKVLLEQRPIQEQRLQVQTDPSQLQDTSLKCFKIFTIFNMICSMLLGLGCLTLYPELQIYNIQVFIIVCIYMSLEVMGFLFALICLGLCYLITKVCPNQIPLCQIGWFPVLYTTSIKLGYILYIPIAIKLMIHYDQYYIPKLVIFTLFYFFVVALIYMIRLALYIFDRNLISKHILQMEDTDVYKTDLEQIEVIKSQVLEERNNWLQQQKNQ